MTDPELEAVRLEVAARHRLGADAVPYLNGQHIEELETSEAALAQLVAATGVQQREQAEPLSDLLANAGAVEARRQRTLVDALHGRQSPGRDLAGLLPETREGPPAQRHRLGVQARLSRAHAHTRGWRRRRFSSRSGSCRCQAATRSLPS